MKARKFDLLYNGGHIWSVPQICILIDLEIAYYLLKKIHFFTHFDSQAVNMTSDFWTLLNIYVTCRCSVTCISVFMSILRLVNN